MLQISNLRTPLVEPVSLTVESGQCVTIEGPSGSGKSLFLRAVVDLDPNEGDVRLGGHPRSSIPAPDWRRRVGLVPAETGWWSDRVGDHFAPEDDPAALLDAVGLPDALGWEVGRLSTGERHRLAIVRALARRPEALLLDEPTATLDAVATSRVEALLAEERDRGVAMIVVTHDSTQPARLSAERYTMARGRLAPLRRAAS